jgi:hypothetical protein
MKSIKDTCCSHFTTIIHFCLYYLLHKLRTIFEFVHAKSLISQKKIVISMTRKRLLKRSARYTHLKWAPEIEVKNFINIFFPLYYWKGKVIITYTHKHNVIFHGIIMNNILHSFIFTAASFVCYCFHYQLLLAVYLLVSVFI